jgi:predicted 3-demethylubiquinone-9 3-methyltransferase (glyoxalase superfamily)
MKNIVKVLGWLLFPYIMVGILVGRKSQSKLGGFMAGFFVFILVYAVIIEPYGEESTTYTGTPISVSVKDIPESKKTLQPSPSQSVKPSIKPSPSPTIKQTVKTTSVKPSVKPSPSPTVKLSVKPSVKPSPKIIVKKETLSQKNAVKAAENYIRIMPFSREGLIKQLKYEGYSTADATYAVDKLKIDYNKQALKAAETYLDMMAFSRSGLIKQLKYEGYTTKQATYAVDKVGL